MAFRNLAERFDAKMEELYSNKRFPAKESADLNPIIVTRPGDPNIDYGQGDGRIAPIGRTATDLARMTRYITSPTGIKFLLNQSILQLANPISETRFIDPTFVVKNVAPYEHFKRQLFDQTDVIVGDPDRSPASTPNVGLAGRLQTQTAAEATSRLIGSDARTSLLDVLGSTTLGKTVTAAFQSLDGTLLVNERPELDVQGEFYSSILWKGRSAILGKETTALIAAFSGLGLGASIVGIPNIIGNIARPLPAVNTRGYQDVQPYFNNDIVDDAQTYLINSRADKRPNLAIPTFTTELVDKIVGLGLAAAARNLLGLGALVTNAKLSSLGEYKQTVAIGPPEPIPPNVLTNIKRSMTFRYLGDPDQTMSPKSNEGIKDTRSKLAIQTEQLSNKKTGWANAMARRGIYGGITLKNIESYEEISTSEESQEFHKRLMEVQGRPGYYHDLLNQIDVIEGTAGLSPVQTPLGEVEIHDYIKVRFLDVTNNKLIPFRAILEGISETVTSEYSSNRYIGRIERNIVYLGASRSLSFTLYVNAFAAKELQHIWKRVNTLTGLMYPSKYTGDGFMAPPIVQLTMGDLYTSQPGYISSLTHTIEDDASWEITEGSQMPQRVQIQMTFEVIEKSAVSALSNFYGYLETVTE